MCSQEQYGNRKDRGLNMVETETVSTISKPPPERAKWLIKNLLTGRNALDFGIAVSETDTAIQVEFSRRRDWRAPIRRRTFQT